jgi:hypothetical protein
MTDPKFEVGEAAPRAPREPLEPAWRCFHCDEVFTDKAEALEHFGSDEWKTPACRLPSTDVARLRELEADNAGHPWRRR